MIEGIPERIGIVGGGQLGRMLTEPALQLGFEVTVVDPNSNCPAAQVGAEQIQADYQDTEAIRRLAKGSDTITWELEHIPGYYLDALAAVAVDVQPSPKTLRIIQDKFLQKRYLEQNGIPVAPFEEFDAELGSPSRGDFIVKARQGGFDGRGNLKVHQLDDPAIPELFGDTPVYVERLVPFERELAVVAARDRQGDIAMYPIVETIHQDNICHTVLAPALIHPRTIRAAEELAHTTMETLEGAGVFAIEMFDMGNGNVLVNEIAPRVHNSGHFTQDACRTSQFEQHIRAITGLPLGSVEMTSKVAVMMNILGRQTSDHLDTTGLDRALGVGDAHVHLYGKTPRPARKVGHITLLGNDLDELLTQARQAREELVRI